MLLVIYQMLVFRSEKPSQSTASMVSALSDVTPGSDEVFALKEEALQSWDVSGNTRCIIQEVVIRSGLSNVGIDPHMSCEVVTRELQVTFCFVVSNSEKMAHCITRMDR